MGKKCPVMVESSNGTVSLLKTAAGIISHALVMYGIYG